MLFTKPNLAALKACWKRAGRYQSIGWRAQRRAKHRTISGDHPLSAAYSNACLLVDAERDKTQGDYAFDIQVLSRFAELVDAHSKTHMIDGDRELIKMLRGWRARMFFDPTLLNDRP